MPDDPTPTTSRRQLGARLRLLRQERGLTAKQVAHDLDVAPSQVSRIESGERTPSEKDMAALARCLDLADDEVARLGEIADAARRRVRRSVTLQPASQESNFAIITQSDFLELESDAIRIREYNSGVLPGLLQTESYMRSNMRGTAPDVGGETFDRAVKMRVDRQRKLATDFEYQVILDAAVLARVVGGPVDMAEQVQVLLDHVRKDKVDLRIIPFTSDLHPGLNSQFVTLRLPEANEVPDAVFSEGLFGHARFDSPSDVSRFETVWLHLYGLSVPAEHALVVLLETLMSQSVEAATGGR